MFSPLALFLADSDGWRRCSSVLIGLAPLLIILTPLDRKVQSRPAILYSASLRDMSTQVFLAIQGAEVRHHRAFAWFRNISPIFRHLEGPLRYLNTHRSRNHSTCQIWINITYRIWINVVIYAFSPLDQLSPGPKGPLPLLGESNPVFLKHKQNICLFCLWFIPGPFHANSYS